jgi:hypothetical protein
MIAADPAPTDGVAEVAAMLLVPSFKSDGGAGSSNEPAGRDNVISGC